VRQVQVDDEVFQAVQSHAVALVDDFNSALRKVLRLAPEVRPGRQPSPMIAKQDKGSFPDLPQGLPKALEQILQVTHLTRGRSRTRQDATRLVALHHRVAPQTVLDKYCRQLGLTADAFDRLLGETGRRELRSRLVSQFPQFASIITAIVQ